MIILQPIATAQTVQVYAREHTTTTYNVEITTEQTSKKNTQSVSGVYSDGVLTFDVTFDFKKERFYAMKVSTSTNHLVNYSMIYVTDQTNMGKYDVLDDYYTTPPDDDSYFVVKPSE